ncbi:hypothetical protein C1G87_0215 [Dehalococcoides mccartyi]|uniref:Uncharacterized protein n=1 Tax=Dehalococcoides mccartyi TaxID=61435 RepID=A0A328EMW4_9CHLR|nr:hypothetical protein [Dehalococcoides mccartyi]RAL69857.1 hypothetical protein C1G87_0215 [Dehalococcoides mccartyi]
MTRLYSFKPITFYLKRIQQNGKPAAKYLFNQANITPNILPVK